MDEEDNECEVGRRARRMKRIRGGGRKKRKMDGRMVELLKMDRRMKDGWKDGRRMEGWKMGGSICNNEEDFGIMKGL